MSSGPKITRDGLVFYYDVNNTKSLIGKPATNFYTNGDFTNGTGITQEAGSNPTNNIVIYPNPGNSQYVLRQTGNYTEYQINLTSQLSSSTTYVLSGWYAESNDYDGTSTMFHCRAFSSSGSHVALGNGIGTVIKTVNAGGLNWKYCYVTITTPSDYNGDFNWYVGYGQPSCNGYRYYTNLQMEIGSYPTTFVDGTRSVTQGLKDLIGGTTIDLSAASFNSNEVPILDGTDDRIDLGNLSDYFPSGVPAVTVEQVFKITSGASGPLAPLFENYRFNLWYDYSNDTFSLNTRSGPPDTSGYQFAVGGTSTITCNPKGNYNHIVGVYETISATQGRVTLYVNGEFAGQYVDIKMGAYPINPTWIGQSYHSGYGTYKLNGRVDLTKLYTSALTANDVKQNYNAIKNRFGI
jgi:hypothetical protein